MVAESEKGLIQIVQIIACSEMARNIFMCCFQMKEVKKSMKIGLVLEGGAMRGMYTAGVLDAFLDKDFGWMALFPFLQVHCLALIILLGKKGGQFVTTRNLYQISVISVLKVW